ncbi:MAG: malonyl-CoA synthase [Gammaproteobacteria bacterium]|nr:malonyl-CoA synthase [Gammaproteobacteria bacterium]MDE0223977.1 malonyl-CoA synthase [Gammaproteobacteria bacterium]
MNDNVYALFETRFCADRDTTCLRLPDRDDRLYGDLEAQASRAAGALLHLGVKPGDRIVTQTEKTPEALALYLGCLKAGAVYVPLNTAYTAAEMKYFLSDAEPALLVCDPSHMVATAVPTETLDASGGGSFAQRMDAAEACESTVVRGPEDIAAIVYTSGTTGRPKGAMLTHRNLESNARTLCDAWGWRSDDVLLHALPIFHVHGLFVALHCVFLGGGSMVFLPRFDADAVIEHLPSSTVMMGVPTFYTRLLGHNAFTRDVCRAMRLFISGSAPLAAQTFADFQARTGHRILERYGMSETLMNTSNPLAGERIGGTVGFALPEIEARIADGDRVLGEGEIGEIEVRGPNVFKGYWRMPDKTAEEFRPDGFFRTGDLGVMDSEGRVSIAGRTKDLIISGGYNVYPKEVETLIDEMSEVSESAVIGVPHPDFGEGVVAVVVPRDGPVDTAMVEAALKDRLARFKQPKRVVCLDDLPRNVMGKVQKNALRERFADLFA